MVLLNTADDVKLGTQQVIFIALGQFRVWPPAAGSQPEIVNFSTAGDITITWKETSLAESYEIRRNGELIATQAERLYTDTGLEWNQSYYYTITPIVLGVPGDESPASMNVRIPRGSIPDLSASSRTYTNVTVSWSPVLGADQYKVYKNGSLYSTITGSSRAITTTADTTITVYVVPYRNGVAGTASPTHTYYSGRAEQRDQGSRTGLVFRPDRIDSWRPVDAWAWLSGVAAQGYYTASYGNYKGVMFYGQYGVRGPLRDALGGGDLGQIRQLRGSCTKAEVYLYKKPNVGTAGRATVTIRLSNSTASGGEPSGWNVITRTSSVSGSGTWIGIGTDRGQALGDGDAKSLMLRNDGPADYAHFNDCRLRLSWSWNYVTVAAKANTWS